MMLLRHLPDDSSRELLSLNLCFSGKLFIRISPEIDWYHFQSASPASGIYVHSPVSNIDKDPYEVKCHFRAQCAPQPSGTFQQFALAIPLLEAPFYSAV